MTRSHDEASGVTNAMCVMPAVILQAYVPPSGPTATFTSTRASPGNSFAITMKPSSLTRTPAMPSPKVEQRKRTTGSACHAAAASCRRQAATPLTAARSALTVAMGHGCLGQVPRRPVDDVALRRDGRVSGRQGRDRLAQQSHPGRTGSADYLQGRRFRDASLLALLAAILFI